MPEALVQAKAIPPKYFDVASVRGHILAELQNNQVPTFLKDFAITTETWRHQPRFFSKYYFAGGDIKVYIYTLDKPWNWLEGGTSVRHVGMHPDFRRKTNPGQLYPRAGRPPFDPQWRSAKRRWPGIKAREWRKIIMKAERLHFVRGINLAVNKGLFKMKSQP